MKTHQRREAPALPFDSAFARQVDQVLHQSPQAQVPVELSQPGRPARLSPSHVLPPQQRDGADRLHQAFVEMLAGHRKAHRRLEAWNAAQPATEVPLAQRAACAAGRSGEDIDAQDGWEIEAAARPADWHARSAAQVARFKRRMLSSFEDGIRADSPAELGAGRAIFNGFFDALHASLQGVEPYFLARQQEAAGAHHHGHHHHGHHHPLRNPDTAAPGRAQPRSAWDFGRRLRRTAATLTSGRGTPLDFDEFLHVFNSMISYLLHANQAREDADAMKERPMSYPGTIGREHGVPDYAISLGISLLLAYFAYKGLKAAIGEGREARQQASAFSQQRRAEEHRLAAMGSSLSLATPHSTALIPPAGKALIRSSHAIGSQRKERFAFAARQRQLDAKAAACNGVAATTMLVSVLLADATKTFHIAAQGRHGSELATEVNGFGSIFLLNPVIAGGATAFGIFMLQKCLRKREDAQAELAMLRARRQTLCALPGFDAFDSRVGTVLDGLESEVGFHRSLTRGMQQFDAGAKGYLGTVAATAALPLVVLAGLRGVAHPASLYVLLGAGLVSACAMLSGSVQLIVKHSRQHGLQEHHDQDHPALERDFLAALDALPLWSANADPLTGCRVRQGLFDEVSRRRSLHDAFVAEAVRSCGAIAPYLSDRSHRVALVRFLEQALDARMGYLAQKYEAKLDFYQAISSQLPGLPEASPSAPGVQADRLQADAQAGIATQYGALLKQANEGIERDHLMLSQATALHSKLQLHRIEADAGTLSDGALAEAIGWFIRCQKAQLFDRTAEPQALSATLQQLEHHLHHEAGEMFDEIEAKLAQTEIQAAKTYLRLAQAHQGVEVA